MSEPCQNKATHLRTWPGQDPDFVCADHAEDSDATLMAMGWPPVTTRLVNEQEAEAVDVQCACTTGRLQRITTG